MAEFVAPGRRLAHVLLTPERRALRGHAGAWAEAARVLAAEYLRHLDGNGAGTFHVILTLDAPLRPRTGREEDA